MSLADYGSCKRDYWKRKAHEATAQLRQLAAEPETRPQEGVSILDDFLIGPHPRLAQPPLRSLSLSFFNRYLSPQTQDEAYLNQANLDLFAPQPFRFSLISD